MKFCHKILGILLSGCICFQTVALCYGITVSDMEESDVYATAVAYTLSKHWLQLDSNNCFQPQASITKGEFYAALAEMAQVEVSNDISSNLSDVQAGQPYTGAVIWAISSGIAESETKNWFGVDAPIERWEAALALAKYGVMSNNLSFQQYFLPIYPDMGGLSAQAITAIGYCAGAGILEGENGLFSPHRHLTRAEGAQALYEFASLPNMTRSTPVEDVSFSQLEDAEQADVVEDVYVDDGFEVGGWTGILEEDFPLSFLNSVSFSDVLDLNQRILIENAPKTMAELGDTIDGNDRHLTNYGTGGITDCINVTTILENRTTEFPADIPLSGNQQYYGYSLQIAGVTDQDIWHHDAMETGKDPWQCTWWAWGRADQYLDLKCGADLLATCDYYETMGNGRDYYKNLSKYFSSGSTPAANTFASWSGGSYGHVAYVEAVDDYGIWVSMADSGRTWRGITYIVRVDSETNPYPLGWYADEQFLGFNYLDQPLYGFAMD